MNKKVINHTKNSLLRYSLAIIVLMLQVNSQVFAQDEVTVEDYARAESMLGANTSGLVYNTVSDINWLDDERMIYRKSISGGMEFILANLQTGDKALAFDHEKLAEALSEETGEELKALRLPFRNFEFSGDESIRFNISEKTYECNIITYSCDTIENKQGADSWDESLSPDGKKAAFIKDYNLWMRDVESGDSTQLTFDGEENYGYATNNAGWTKRDGPVLLWSPNSDRIAIFQHDSRDTGEMYLLSTAVGQSELEKWKYPLPGDSLIFRIERVVINLDPEPEVVRLEMEPDAHRSTITDHIAGWGGQLLDVEWSENSEELAFVSVSRDHKDAHLQVADPETGEVRSVLEEHQETYFESGYKNISWSVLNDTDEVIWFSERDDWGHLYLYDLNNGDLKHQITEGDWRVLDVVKVDAENRKIYFTGSAIEEGNPYYQYLYSIDINGENLKLLTPGKANHVVNISDKGDYLVDTYSTPDTPAISILRDLEGNEIMTLEEADISDLVAHGWKPPTEFQVKARDGETDLYGLMYKPTNFDETKSYPILNYLYPGPQSGSVGTRSFIPSRSDKQAVAELGFIVVEVDAMGTPGRSKSFHDFYYGNMGDNGVPDQIATIEQLDDENSWMDIERVGIWGHSGGGFASTRAILAYPDFYKVAVSGAGNHDNRNYADAWGEKWQGLLNQEGDTTNYDNQANQLLAENLKGKLLLAHGTLDSNVPPFNTLLVVDALIAANKDFDLLMLPNRRHGFSNERYMLRTRWDYFVRHLKNVEPPKEYEFGDNIR